MIRIRTIYLITIGFDEKFAVRFLLRHKVKKNDIIAVITPDDYRKNPKVMAAINTLKKLTNSWISEENFRIIAINLKKDKIEWSIQIHKFLDEFLDFEVKTLLSGGMRAVIIMTFIALTTYNKAKKIDVEIDFENLESFITIPIHVLRIRKSNRFYKILSLIQAEPGISIREISRKLNISAPTISREVKTLRRYGLLKHDNVLILSNDGEFYLKYYEL